MENIGQYIGACTHLGVASQDLFTPVDLFGEKDMVAVVRNLHALSRIAKQLGFGGPSIGSHPAPRHFKSPLAPRWSPSARSTRWGVTGADKRTTERAYSG
jgi:hypothetical protein